MQSTAFGRFVLDPKRRTLLADGKPVRLQARAFDILAMLVANRDRPISRDEIIAAVWQGQAVSESNLTVQMSNLRRVLGEHGGVDLIITVPGRFYRFVGETTEQDNGQAGPATVQSILDGTFDGHPDTRGPWHGAIRLAAWGMIAAACVCTILAGIVAWNVSGARLHSAAHEMVAHLRVETSPDEVYMKSGTLHYVDYIFTVLDPVDLQLETEDWQFVTTSGMPLGPAMVGGRIYKGSLPIRGGTTGVYHNNIYLIPEVVATARSTGNTEVQLRHLFHLRDAQGNALQVPAVLLIHLDPWTAMK